MRPRRPGDDRSAGRAASGRSFWLPTSPIARFACHGASHPTDPSRSYLLLHDHASDPLTVVSLSPVRLDRTQLAHLSACRTAAIDTPEFLDEAIHLTSAFQLAWFPHVIGTLWEIDDQIAVTIADAFYTHLRNGEGVIDTSRAVWALHQAARAWWNAPGVGHPSRCPVCPPGLGDSDGCTVDRADWTVCHSSYHQQPDP
ncbi:CHAT domain-containing protein [Streptomyces djakartensis]|uniref:CHAT domain-containing protein n=1 Tax=Streptomyces djakartensis TaxID=68193 RepID=A0ABQ2Z6E0_9ACTN|nr:CHAT domain-containing protein [Streptomyces djakartensis]GGY02634.1 hypothetical protein GCM10010384_03200 [Streptomyces djakartensis]